MTIGVIGAMQMEVDDLKAQMTDTQTEVYSGVEFVEGKIGDHLHCRYSHLLHCVRIASGLSVGQQGRFYARNDLKWPPFHSGHNSGIAFIVMQNRSDRGLTGSAFSREGPQPENASSLCGLLC